MPPKDSNNDLHLYLVDSVEIDIEEGEPKYNESDAQKLAEGNERLTDQFRDDFLKAAREYNKQKHENNIWFDLASTPYPPILGYWRSMDRYWTHYGTCNCDFDINLRRKYDDWYRKKVKEMTQREYHMDKLRLAQIPKIDSVIFNGDATIVFWNDGEKTVVKRSEGECDDREKAILTAFVIKTLGGKPELNKMVRKAFKDKEPKRYRWTDICKIRFDEFEKEDNNRLVPFMLGIEKVFDQFGYLSMMKLRELAEKHDIFKNGHEPFEMCKFELKHADKEMLVWKNRDDFGLVREADLKKNKWYYHIYIRRSPEPKPYPDDGKGEEE